MMTYLEGLRIPENQMENQNQKVEMKAVEMKAVEMKAVEMRAKMENLVMGSHSVFCD
jgi:hypothetical protein